MADSINSAHSDSSSDSNASNSMSLGSSMVSMKTQDHNELYDHRQHPDFDDINTSKEHEGKKYGCSASKKKGKRRKNSKMTPEDPLSTPPQLAHVETSSSSNNIPPTRQRFRRYSHQSCLQTSSFPPLQNVPSNETQGSTDPVREAAAMALHEFNTSTRPSRLAHCITSVSSQSPPHPSHHTNLDGIRPESAGPNSPPARPHLGSNTHSLAEALHQRKRTRTGSIVSAPSNVIKLVKTKSSEKNDGHMRRETTRGTYDSDNSQDSRDSQETEEDVCFPMAPQLHTRINGVDFDELEEFAESTKQMREQYISSTKKAPGVTAPTSVSSGNSFSTSSMSSSALKYTPRPPAHQHNGQETHLAEESEKPFEKVKKDNYAADEGTTPGVTFGGKYKVEGDDEASFTPQCITPEYFDGINNFVIPNRFSFFRSDTEETVHASDIASLVKPGQSFYDLFQAGEPTWWLDCSCPTDDEMRCIAKAFGIHPLTAEDIRIQETREKVELFKSYYFVCFHTFEADKESEDFLEPINVYLVVFRGGMLTFHFRPIEHCANVRRRVRQLRDYVNVNSDWMCYALIDDITDSFAPVIQSVEYEADVIEDSVFMVRDINFSVMLQRIGESRRKTMTLMRLLSGKADVIKMFAKRCQDEANGIGPALTSDINIANLQAGENAEYKIQPRGDIAMYLGDIQDHLLTMYQNLAAYEKIFSRSHTNYLAQLQVESFNSNNKVTELLGYATMVGTILVPLNVITGLFGMNVKVPGQDSSIAWWFGILGVLIAIGLIGLIFAKYAIGNMSAPQTLNEAADSSGKSVISSFFPRVTKNKNKNKNVHDPFAPNSRSSNQSMNSLPSKLSRYA
ncbi:magnesium transporter CorA family protein KNAG_0I00830 [Huiozyma naganishii CBS 8797]|uniref:Uncharacterized protein n=1 Tax=Huiozyma naganishii (strain ATCC MYA-139 / BCRC 22969 / CBS 8797 / KCTC 17520 / NBRC 10181 / NCYC 3082 / Yp74L-3) TaxID=1071383 RepID=J7S924_HUIN7|nr:hypothetical protein KNAG_0I00830 [Kazachstania naganishii CBS 8797]CCK71874.1 hypothetical protein KNAG_0I00830 [Kazachstania naganishii CBS 8797]